MFSKLLNIPATRLLGIMFVLQISPSMLLPVPFLLRCNDLTVSKKETIFTKYTLENDYGMNINSDETVVLTSQQSKQVRHCESQA